MKTAEAQAHLDAIDNARASIKTLMGTIRKHQTALIGVAVKTYNEASADLDGMVADTHWTVIGFAPCDASPIGVCVYNERVMTLPSQRRHQTEARTPPFTRPCHSECSTEACLFCGTPMGKDHEYEGRRQIVPTKTP